MAKRFDNDFDAEGFVENFRAKEDTSASCPDNDERIRMRDVPVRKHDVAGSVQGEPALADEYQARFIDDLKYRLPPAGWPIGEDFAGVQDKDCQHGEYVPEFPVQSIHFHQQCAGTAFPRL